jgi:uncharacterized protein (TIGR03437 family)
MRVTAVPAFLFYLAAVSSQVWASPITLGQSNQNFGLTGIGANASGEGQNNVTWGSCAFDGTNTNCTVSGPYTGLGAGGTYSFVLSYPGNGAFPLIAVSQSPGSNLFVYQAKSNYSLVITLVENGGPTVSFFSFANFSFYYTSAATCTGVASCAVGVVGQTPGATMTGPITGSFDPAPAITPSGVISAGNYGGFPIIAPGTWVEIYGVNLATTLSRTWATSDFTGIEAPNALAGTTVTVAGIPAFIDFVSPAQVNIQVPSGVAAGTQPVVVTTAGGSSAAYTVTVNSVEPGLLAPPSFILNGAQNVVALFSNTLTYVLPVALPGVATALAKPGDSITFYGIGFGPVTPDTPAGQIVQQADALQSAFKVFFAGTPATVSYAGLVVGYLGLYQFNVVVPQVAAGNTVPITFTLGGASGPQNLVIAIKN